MPTECHLIVDPPLAGSWNMAVDEWLLERAANEGVSALRFYEWSEPTLSLGYFQAYVDRQSHLASRSCPVVRRASGGGALVHDRELTYSLAVPPSHRLAGNSRELYDVAHRSLIEALATIVQVAEGVLGRVRETVARGGDEPFLCFSRRAQGDVIFAKSITSRSHSLDGCDKICGSAQRRRRGAVLQHGGVLLGQSPAAPELPGIRELCGQAITSAALREAWSRLLAEQAGLRLVAHPPLTGDELAAIRGIEAAKFTHGAWTRRR
jgi:lipoyl(octanoyl) transferase